MNHLNSDLRKISNLTFQWKMSFNTNPSKEAQEIISLIKSKIHIILLFISITSRSNKSLFKNHLKMILETKLNFQENLKNVSNNVNKIIGLLRKLQIILPRGPLVTICKLFIRVHLDYGLR